MDQVITKIYRKYLQANFPNSGELKNASIFMEAVGQHMLHCGEAGNFMHLYLQVENERITEIKYLCSCEPATNVAVEILCDLVKGRTLAEARVLTEKPFYQIAGSRDEEFCLKVRGLLEMLREGIASYNPARKSG